MFAHPFIYWNTNESQQYHDFMLSLNENKASTNG